MICEERKQPPLLMKKDPRNAEWSREARGKVLTGNAFEPSSISLLIVRLPISRMYDAGRCNVINLTITATASESSSFRGQKTLKTDLQTARGYTCVSLAKARLLPPPSFPGRRGSKERIQQNYKAAAGDQSARDWTCTVEILGLGMLIQVNLMYSLIERSSRKYLS